MKRRMYQLSNDPGKSHRSPVERKRRQKGGGLVEFGLILPAFLLLTFGIIDFGRGIWAYNTLSHAVREGARYAATHGSASQYPASSTRIGQEVKERAVGLDPRDLSVTTTWQPDSNPGSVVQVQVQYSFKPFTPLLPQNTIQFRSGTRMVISY